MSHTPMCAATKFPLALAVSTLAWFAHVPKRSVSVNEIIVERLLKLASCESMDVEAAEAVFVPAAPVE